MNSDQNTQSPAAKAIGRIGFAVGAIAMACLLGLCLVEIAAPSDICRIGISGLMVLSLMFVMNVLSIALSMFIIKRCNVWTATTLIMYLILSVYFDTKQIIADMGHPSIAVMALFFFYPFARPLPFILLLTCGFLVDRFRNA